MLVSSTFEIKNVTFSSRRIFTKLNFLYKYRQGLIYRLFVICRRRHIVFKLTYKCYVTTRGGFSSWILLVRQRILASNLNGIGSVHF